MANRAVADDRFTLDDLSDDIDLVDGEKDANALADCDSIATDCDKISVGARANRNVVSETENAFRT